MQPAYVLALAVLLLSKQTDLGFFQNDNDV